MKLKISVALILAGGLGTRLRDHLPQFTKPMAPVDGRPFLEYLILQLRHAGIADIILSVGYMADQIVNHFGDGSSMGTRISYIKEDAPRGTGGALKLAQPFLEGRHDFLLMNGDSFFGIDISSLGKFHFERNVLATLSLLKHQTGNRYGTVFINEKNEITRFREKGESTPDSLIYGGICLCSREIFSHLPEKEIFSIEKEVFPDLVGKGFYGIAYDRYFIDIGIPEDYIRAQNELRRHFPYDYPV